jgi:hypothetical protein
MVARITRIPSALNSLTNQFRSVTIITKCLNIVTFSKNVLAVFYELLLSLPNV